MNDNELRKFIELYEKITNLKSVKCRLMHERVQIDKTSKLPITKNVGEIVYDRIGFCRPEIRNERTSCGHTMAHISLLEAVKLLEAEGNITGDLRKELNNLTNRIYQLDHKKGDAEKNLAVLIEKQFYEPEEVSEKNLEAVAAIKEIETQHDECVEGLGNLRDQIIKEMRVLIEKS
ncbi:hypothetical protein BH10ACI1_BH10ACI1_01060 [soil metagenome]